MLTIYFRRRANICILPTIAIALSAVAPTFNHTQNIVTSLPVVNLSLVAQSTTNILLENKWAFLPSVSIILQSWSNRSRIPMPGDDNRDSPLAIMARQHRGINAESLPSLFANPLTKIEAAKKFESIIARKRYEPIN